LGYFWASTTAEILAAMKADKRGWIMVFLKVELTVA